MLTHQSIVLPGTGQIPIRDIMNGNHRGHTFAPMPIRDGDSKDIVVSHELVISDRKDTVV